MAIIQIPIGGVSVGVEIPDFATEYTADQILNELRQQSASLGVVAAKTSQTANISNATITSSAASTSSDNVANSIGQKITNAIQPLMSSENLAESIRGMFSGLGFEGLGAAIGTAVGIIEQLGNAMGNFARVGANAGASLVELRNSAGEIGLGLHELSGYVGTFGTTITSLGKNSTEGTRKLTDFVAQLRTTTQDVGYFGMNSKEMTQLMIDELEIRRQNTSNMEMQNIQAGQLTEALKEQYIQQMSIARLTGQDVHARIRARMDMERDAVGAAALAQLQGEAGQAAREAAQSLTELGAGAQPMLQQAMANMILGLKPDLGNDGFTQYAAMAQSARIDVRGYLEQIAQSIASGNSETTNALIHQMAGAFDNLSEAQRGELARYSIAGVGGAAEVLTTAMQAVPPVLDQATGDIAGSAVDFTTAISRSRAQLEDEIASGSMKMMGITAEFEVATQSLQRAISNIVLGMMGISRNTEGAAYDRITSVIQGIAATLDTGADATEILNMVGGELSNALQEMFANPASRLADQLSPLLDGVGRALDDAAARDGEIASAIRDLKDFIARNP